MIALTLLHALGPHASHAHAQLRPSGDADFWQRLRLRAELGFSGRSDYASSFHVLSPLLSGDFAFSNGFGVGIDWGFVFALEAPAHASSAVAVAQGDPLLKVWYASPRARDRFEVYAGLSVPTAWLPRDVVQRGLTRNAYAFAAATRGLWNAWLWAPEQVALVLSGKYVRQVVPNLRLVVEAAAAGAVALSRLTERAETGYAQLAPALELHDDLITFGLRVQAALTGAREDPLQWSSGAYARVALGTLQLEAAALCNLDAPLGMSGAAPSVWGAWIGAEVRP